MYNKYYQDELTFLREQGAEFAKAYPKIAHMLAESGSDPDVERLLEGFAFLTGRVRQKLDSELYELTSNVIGLLWPHYLRPVPSMSILQFEAGSRQLADAQTVDRGTMVESTAVEGTRCKFRTTCDTTIYPFKLTDIELALPLSEPASLRMEFALTGGAQMEQLDLRKLRLYLAGEPKISYTLYLYLCRYATQVTFAAKTEGVVRSKLTVDREVIQPAGFADDEALLPYPAFSFSGYRLLQEFFALPEKFLFIDIDRLDTLSRLGVEDKFEITIEFSHRPDDAVRVRKDNIRLGCVPVVNLFSNSADPIRVEHDKTEYLLRAQGGDRTHYEIFSINKVNGWEQGSSEKREYLPFFSFTHSLGPENQNTEYYHVEIRPAVIGRGTDTYISFVTGQQSGVVPPSQIIAVDITSTNRDLPEKLRVGDINVRTVGSPNFADFNNITAVTPMIVPPLTGGLFWRLISHLSLNYLSLIDLRNLRGILELYNFRALYDRQAARANELRLDGIKTVTAEPDTYLHRGVPMRGLSIAMTMDEDSFAGEGELYLFASILSRFFNLYATINSYSRLTVTGVRHGEVYQWPAMMGAQRLI